MGFPSEMKFRGRTVAEFLEYVDSATTDEAEGITWIKQRLSAIQAEAEKYDRRAEKSYREMAQMVVQDPDALLEREERYLVGLGAPVTRHSILYGAAAAIHADDKWTEEELTRFNGLRSELGNALYAGSRLKEEWIAVLEPDLDRRLYELREHTDPEPPSTEPPPHTQKAQTQTAKPLQLLMPDTTALQLVQEFMAVGAMSLPLDCDASWVVRNHFTTQQTIASFTASTEPLRWNWSRAALVRVAQMLREGTLLAPFNYDHLAAHFLVGGERVVGRQLRNARKSTGNRYPDAEQRAVDLLKRVRPLMNPAVGR
jgi:hypothetical protein